MKQTFSLNTNPVEFSLSKFDTLINFRSLFENIRRGFEKEQKDLMFEKKSKKEISEYFDIVKFLLTSPR